jgi:hypothetical protein
MKYMILMHSTAKDWASMGTWPPEAVAAMIQSMDELNEELKRRGEFVLAEGLTPPSEAKLVRARPDGSPAVTDGPFPEAKEFLAGWWIVDVENEARVLALAAQISAAPGGDGKPMNFAVEVRPMGEAPKA